MSITLITAPTQDVVTLDEAKLHLRLTTTDKDDLIEAMIQAASASFDPAFGGWLGRALRPQTWELRLPAFIGASFFAMYPDEFALKASPCAAIELPFPPLISVDSVKYYSTAGVDTTLTEGVGFRVLNSGGLGKQSIAPLYGESWPTCRVDAESVRIRFTCGYDGTDDPDPLPAPIKQAVHLAIRNLDSLGERSMFVSSRKIEGVSETSWFAGDTAAKLIQAATENLLSTYRVW